MFEKKCNNSKKRNWYFEKKRFKNVCAVLETTRLLGPLIQQFLIPWLHCCHCHNLIPFPLSSSFVITNNHVCIQQLLLGSCLAAGNQITGRNLYCSDHSVKLWTHFKRLRSGLTFTNDFLTCQQKNVKNIFWNWKKCKICIVKHWLQTCCFRIIIQSKNIFFVKVYI